MDKPRWSDSQVRILVVADSRQLRAILRLFLERRARGARRSEFRVVGEAETGEEAIVFVEDNDADLALMDVDMPGIGGVEATRRLREVGERLLVVGLVSRDDHQTKQRMLEAGAIACLPKTLTPNQLTAELDAVARRERERPA